MRRPLRLPIAPILFAVALAALAPASPAAAASHPHTRQGWLVGIGLGAGGLQVGDSGVSSNRETGGVGSLRAGYAFNSKLSLELDGTAWTRDDQGTRFTFAVSGVGLNFYPGESGLVLRAGVGGGTGKVEQQQGNVTVSATENGLGLMGGIGYEFRVTPRFALGPQVNVGWADLDSFNADWFTGELAVCWYFIKR
ncbi:MAG TPA: outer membrane beta-barrel protein [Candidatus Eisenbacteria bacterium]|nr:outer membrane beta-barrel protein [Candidatus Eisenbacteria bacterium]